MNATRAKQLIGLTMVIGLWISLTAPPVFPPSQSLLADVVAKSRTASLSRQSRSQSGIPESIEQTKERVSEAYGRLPISFEINRGQTDGSVKFLARGRGYNLFLTATEAVLSLRRGSQPTVRESKVAKAGHRKDSALASHASTSTSTLRMKIVGADSEAQVAGEEQLPGTINYFTGRDPENWQRNVASYAKVRYQNIYPGVDMLYYGNQRELEYDFIVDPGVDPSIIKLAMTEARKLSVADNGDLILRTVGGELRQRKPVAYQETNGTRQTVAAHYVIKDGQIGFQVDAYDTGRPLVIDPVLSYSTYLGGAGNYEVGFGVAVDAQGNAYVVGTTASADYPLTPGAPQSTIGGGNSAGDAFVTKLNAAGSALVYSTYLGGSARDFAWDIAVDADGNAYVTGDTESFDFATTPGAFQVAHAAGTEVDGFVAKLDPTGSSLVYSTYLGGSGNEDSRAITVNTLGEAYVTGETPSTDFPITPGSYRTVIGSDNSNHDVFVTKLNANGTALGYSTFLGSSSATGLDIALDPAGNAYVVGVTIYSPPAFTFPVTPNAHQSIGGAEGFNGDGFISELNATGTDLLYSSYLGGSMEESAVGVALDSSNNVYVTGHTGSTDFPVTPGCAQAVFGGPYDTFISKFDLATSPTASLIYSTYLGGSSLEDPHGIAVDSGGNAYVAGYTQSSDFPVTESLGATGFLNAFVAKLNPTGSQFLYSTRFGDTYTYGYALAVDSAGNAYVVGQTTSSSFATTPGAFQPSLAGGGSDAFVVKIDFATRLADLSATANAQPYEVAPGGTLVFNSEVTNIGPAQATDVSVEVIVPPEVAIDDINTPGGTCTTTPDAQGLGYRVVCSFGNVASGQVRTVAIGVTVNAIDGTGMQAVTTVSSSSPDPDTNNNAAYAPAVVRVPTPPSANLIASAGLDLLAANGATVTHNVSTFNNGPDAASNVTYTIQLPPGATYDSATNPYGSCTASAPDAQGTLVTCTVGDIPIYESRLISHTAIVSGAPYEVLTFTSTVSSDTLDPYLDSNVVSVQVQIEGPPVPTPTPATGANPLIAFETRRDGNSEIYSRRADGSAQVNLTNDPADDADFVWSPDGLKLAFSRLVDAGSNNRELFVMNADGSNLLRLTNSTDDQDSGPVWSPDGTKLLFTSMSNASNTRALWVTNVDGSNQIRIGVAVYDYDNDPTWSPDGTKIAYARDYYDGMNPTERNIYTANADGSNRTRIANAPGESDFTPAWSADGTKINFVREVGGIVDIYDMDVDGSNQRNLSNLGNVYGYPAPVRSADRSKIAFVTGISGNPTVYVMNADGSSRVSVFNTTYYVATLGWSPDGTKLVVGTIFNVGLGAGIHVVNADGSGLIHFGGDAEYNQDPNWSPDGTRLAFTTRRTGNNGIDIINADGTGRVDLTNDPAYYRHPKWQPAQQGNTPAGTNVTVTSNGATVTFSNVTMAGQTTITPIDPNSLSGIPGEYVINANSLAFEITTTATYTGPITIGFQVPGVNNPITFSTLRVLHGEPPPVPNFVDRTILAPDSPTHDFPARTIYARVTSLSPFVIAEKSGNQMTALGPAQVWIGLKNSDDVGTKFDLLAEVFKNGTLIGSGQINNVAGGSSGFNNAKLNAINLALSGTASFGAGNTLSFRLSVRIAASSSHRSGTARLWFNDAAANSRFSATIGGVTNSYYLRKLNNSLVLTTATGSTPKVTIDVLVDRAEGGNPFKPFGTWLITF